MSKVIILLATGFEEVEAITVIDILRRADIDTTIVGLEKELIKGSHDISIKGDMYYEDININEYDFMILPGGQPGTNNLKSNSKVIKWLQKFNDEKRNIAAICAAPTVLEKANIIENVKITSYPSEKDMFNADLYCEENVVKDNNIITSRGVGTAIDFSLELVNSIKGKKIRDKVASKILWR